MINGQPEIDPYSETAQVLRAKIKDAIGANQRVCCKPGTPHDETENARGALAALEGLLKLIEPSNMQSGSKVNLE